MDAAYQQALDYIYSFIDFERNPLPLPTLHFDLRRMAALMDRIGNPHLAAKTVHIAGTKGKGSVAAMAASVLNVSGYATGLYTSPHLNAYNERIRIDGSMITEGELVMLVDRLKPSIERVNREAAYGVLTTFEVTTAIAFEYFRSKGVDFQVIETGMGGRLDATNVVDPEVSVITSISLDHTKVLGDTLTKIAAEKAGIVKPGKPVVSAPQTDEVDAVLVQNCREKGSDLIRVGKDVTLQYLGSEGERQSCRVNGRLGSYELVLPLLGRHQLDNAAVAIAALEILKERGTGITAESMIRGIAATEWPGRLQVLGRRPLVVVDGAHNAESATRLRQSLKEYFTYDKAVLIIGVSADKDLGGIISELVPDFDRVIATRSAHPRAMSTSALVAVLQEAGIKAEATSDIAEALRSAQKSAGPNDLICVAGSLFVVGEAIEHFRQGRS